MALDPALRNWRNAVFGLFGIAGLTVASWASRVPAIRDAIHVTPDQLGLMLVGGSIGSIIGLSVAPTILHHLRMRPGLVLLNLTGLTGVLIVGVGASVHQLAVVEVGLVLWSGGNGAADVFMNVSAAAVEKKIGRTIMPIMHGGFSLGTVTGAALGSVAEALAIPLLWHLVGLAIVLAAGVLLLVRFVPDVDEHTGEPTDRPPLRERLTVWRDGRLILIGVVVLAMTFAEGSANDWLALGAVDGHGETQAAGAAIFGVFVGAMTLGRFFGGGFVDRVGRTWAIRLTASVSVVGLLMFIIGGQPWIYIVGAGLWGIGCSLGFPLGMSAAADDDRNATARVSAVAMIGYCAFLGGPPLIGFLAREFGVLHGLYAILAMLVIAVLLASALRSRRTRQNT